MGEGSNQREGNRGSNYGEGDSSNYRVAGGSKFVNVDSKLTSISCDRL